MESPKDCRQYFESGIQKRKVIPLSGVLVSIPAQFFLITEYSYRRGWDDY